MHTKFWSKLLKRARFWGNNIKIDLQEVGCDTVMNIWVTQIAFNVLTRWTTIIFLRRTLLHGVSFSWQDERFFSLPKRPHRLWGPPSLLLCRLWWRGAFSSVGKTAGAFGHLVPTLKMSGTVPLLPLYTFVVCTVTTLHLPLNCEGVKDI